MMQPGFSSIKPQTPPSNPINFGLILRGIGSHPIFFLFFLMLAGSAAVAIWMFLPLPKMTAYAIFKIEAQAPAVLTPIGDGKTDFNLYRQTQTILIRNRTVLDSALSDPKIRENEMLNRMSDPLAWLESKIGTNFDLGPEYMKVSLEGDNAETLLPVLQAVIDAYSKKVVNIDRAKRQERFDQLKTLFDKETEKLQIGRKKIREISETLGSGEPIALATKEKYMQEHIGMTTRELFLIEREIQKTMAIEEARIQKLGGLEEIPVPAELVEAELKAEIEYRAVEDRIRRLEVDISNFQAVLAKGVTHNVLEQKKRDLDEARKELTQVATKLRPSVTARLKERGLIPSKAKIGNLQERLEDLQAQQSAMKNDVIRLAAKLKEMNLNQVNLEDLKKEIAEMERFSEKLSMRIEEMKPELDTPTRVSIWQPATTMNGIEGNRRMKYSMMAGLGLLLMGLVISTAREYRHRRIVCTSDIQGSLGLRLLGTVPLIPSGGAETASEHWKHVLSESVDMTRTMLLNGNHGNESPRFLMVTSAVAGEGKSSLSGHLAISLARAGFRVVLIDGDLRRPSLHTLLQTSQCPGLCETLRGEANLLEEAVQETPIPGLSLLPAGKWNVRASQSLVGERWRSVQEVLLANFDYIILDSSPLLPVTDPLLMARHADGVILSVMRGESQLHSLEEAQAKLASVGANVLGVVVNGVAIPRYHNYYGTYAISRDAEVASVS